MSDERPASLLAARIGLYLGPVAFLAIILSPAPGSLSVAGWRTAGVMALMMVWWITEAVPIPVTSLLPLALFPLLLFLIALLVIPGADHFFHRPLGHSGNEPAIGLMAIARGQRDRGHMNAADDRLSGRRRRSISPERL